LQLHLADTLFLAPIRRRFEGNDRMDPKHHVGFDLQRFVQAQQPIYATALAELAAGEKRSHWMWFIFPQADGLGHSEMARRYALRSLDEAIGYLAHPLLGARLVECTGAVLRHTDRSAHAIFGAPDDAKFRSCMTLFATADRSGGVYREALQSFFAGQRDDKTERIISDWQHRHPRR
jgi:uncharacterized protein (DUF1810 family)